MTYTIKQIADLAGVTTRTLRYYDEVGLLTPARIGSNGYRYYDKSSLLTLQQILFFRELDVPLEEIQQILVQPGFDLAEALENHKRALQARSARLDALIETVDQTIATLEGEWLMNDKDYFEGFDESKYEEEAKERWGDSASYAQSMKRWASYTDQQKAAIKKKGGEITRRMVGEDPNLTPDDPGVQAAISEYHVYMNEYFYDCDAEFLRELAEMWVQDPRFARNYEQIREGGAEFVHNAVNIFCDRHEE